jgi:aspartyl-tRNA(Asn)/glutamyl-tRNA(Gln) amidotransferase subunit C
MRSGRRKRSPKTPFAPGWALENRGPGCIGAAEAGKRASQYIPRISSKGFHMQVDEATVRRIARLARIKISDAEAKSLEKELSGILDWVKQLEEVDTTSVEPMTRVVAQKLKMRDDVVTDGDIADAVTANAPLVEDHYFVVPKVVE